MGAKTIAFAGEDAEVDSNSVTVGLLLRVTKAPRLSTCFEEPARLTAWLVIEVFGEI